VAKNNANQKKKKDPNAPKRPQSAWMYFGADMRPKLKAENPGEKQSEILKILSERWKELTDEDKEPFEKKAKKDKARYVAEKAAYKPKKEEEEEEEES